MQESVFILSCIQYCSYMKLMSFCCLTNIFWSTLKNWRQLTILKLGLNVHKKKVTYTISAQYVKACRRKVRKTVTEGRRHGRTIGRTDIAIQYVVPSEDGCIKSTKYGYKMKINIHKLVIMIYF